MIEILIRKLTERNLPDIIISIHSSKDITKQKGFRSDEKRNRFAKRTYCQFSCQTGSANYGDIFDTKKHKFRKKIDIVTVFV